MTLTEALTAATARLTQNEHLRDTAIRDAQLLLLHASQLPRTTLLAHPTLELTPTQQSTYEASIQRRLTLEPIQYITGTQEFYGLTLHVTPAVLIPRPETELLVETVLQHLPTDRPLRIVDVGTGSGAIAIALAHHFPQAHLTALDLSTQALAIAQQNAETHQLADRIRFLHSDLLEAITDEAPFDAILSNPPYIPTPDLASLHPQVRNHEPHTALFAGPVGLDIYTRLIPQAHHALKPGGLLALEIGYGQAESIRQLLAQWKDLSIYNDLQQIPRTILVRKPTA